MAEENPNPIVAVGAVIWNAAREVVLIRRAAFPRAGEWSIPGGKVVFGETLREALIREVREETGLEIDIVGLIDAVDFFAPDTGVDISHHYVLIDFAARQTGGALRAGTDAEEARWVPYAELDRYELWSETRRIIAASARQTNFTE